MKIRKPNDFHHHLRDDNFLSLTVPHCFSNFKNVIVMPNLVPPITTINQAIEYRNRILKIDKNSGNPMMTLYFNKNLNYDDLKKFKENPYMHGIKYYPKNATTNSNFGIQDIKEVFHILKIMENEEIPLLIHGESIKFNVDIFENRLLIFSLSKFV